MIAFLIVNHYHYEEIVITGGFENENDGRK